MNEAKSQETQTDGENQDQTTIEYYLNESLKAQEKSIAHLKTSIGVFKGVGITFVVFCAVTITYNSVQDRKEYKEALVNIREYRKETLDYSKETLKCLEDIKGKSETVIKDIKNEGDDVIGQIEAKSAEWMKKLHDEVVNQRKVFSLWIKVREDQDVDSVLSYLDQLEKLEPDNWLVYDYRGSEYRTMAKNTHEQDKKGVLLNKAKDEFIKSYDLHPGICVIVIADIYAKLDNEGKCKEWLERGMTDDTLSNYDKAREWGSNLHKYSTKDWFKEIRWKDEPPR